jgi:hypothetical protein
MALRIVPFEASHADAVAAFNRRMAEHGTGWSFPTQPEPSWLSRRACDLLYQEFFLACDGATVRGAYALQHRAVSLGGVVEPAANWYLPISEGFVDPRHAMVAPALVRDALRREPSNFVLGMGGLETPLSQLTGRLGYRPRKVPSFLRVEHGGRFAREARSLRAHAGLARALDLAAASGLASLGAALARLALRNGPRLGRAHAEVVPEFGPWADAVWERCRGRYSFVSLRDAATLSRVYPAVRPRIERLRLERDGEPIGWAVLQHAQMKGNPRFGSLHVGRITDCLAAPEDAAIVIRAAADRLAALGVDAMFSNQTHPSWCRALRRNAFLPAPSSMAFSASPDLRKRIEAIDPSGRALHVNRGDGDGPWGHDPRSF